MRTSISYYTAKGIEKIKEALLHLQHVEIPELSAQVAEARKKGDLSENADYIANEAALAKARMKENELKNRLAHARVIEKKDIDISKVCILARVTVLDSRDDKEKMYKLVSEDEIEVKTGKISIHSPIGRGLLGKKKGDTITIEVPAGDVTFTIIDIST